MPTRAMRLGERTSGYSQTSQRVLAWGDWFQVGWVDAGRNSTQVVNNQTVWDWPDEQLVGDAMSHQQPGDSWLSNVAVPSAVGGPFPYPALVWSSALDLLPEAFGQGASHA